MMIFALVMSFSINVGLSSIFLVSIPVLGVALMYIALKAHPNFEKYLKI